MVASTCISCIAQLLFPLIFMIPRKQLNSHKRANATGYIRNDHHENRLPLPRRRIDKQLRPITIQCNHIHEQMRRFHVIEDGEEHGSKVSIVDSIRALEVEVRTEIVVIDEDEDIDEDENVEGGLGTFTGEATHVNCVEND